MAHGYFRWAGNPSSPLHADVGSVGTVPIRVDCCYFGFSGRNGVCLGIRLPRYDVAFGFVGLEIWRKEEEWDRLCVETAGNPQESHVHRHGISPSRMNPSGVYLCTSPGNMRINMTH